MVCEARRDVERRRPEAMLSLQFATGKSPKDDASRWYFHPRSCPRDDGTRRITLEARSELKTLTADLTAGEAAELMFALGSALEQAARDERCSASDLPRLEAISGDRA